LGGDTGNNVNAFLPNDYPWICGPLRRHVPGQFFGQNARFEGRTNANAAPMTDTQRRKARFLGQIAQLPGSAEINAYPTLRGLGPWLTPPRLIWPHRIAKVTAPPATGLSESAE
jgi:hypothetical protein